MKIKEINVNKLFSFSKSGFDIENNPIKFLDFNFIIGKNNSSKTGVLNMSLTTADNQNGSNLYVPGYCKTEFIIYDS